MLAPIEIERMRRTICENRPSKLDQRDSHFLSERRIGHVCHTTLSQCVKVCPVILAGGDLDLRAAIRFRRDPGSDQRWRTSRHRRGRRPSACRAGDGMSARCKARNDGADRPSQWMPSRVAPFCFTRARTGESAQRYSNGHKSVDAVDDPVRTVSLEWNAFGRNNSGAGLPRAARRRTT
jgi:hypothetical protein